MRAVQTCDGCGQADDHPNVHYGIETYHHDCLPHRIYRDLTTVGTYVNGVYVETPEVPMSEEAAATVARLVDIVDACKGGLRGDDLLAFITAEED
jgi:hypothetical protein